MRRELPKVGDIKKKIKFALFPVLVGNLNGGTWIWLERVEVTYIYESRYRESVRWHRDSVLSINKVKNYEEQGNIRKRKLLRNCTKLRNFL